MGCQSAFVSPIIIPTGLPGSPGTPGTAGANGTAALINTIGTEYVSSSTGDQSFVDYDTVAAAFNAGDVISIDAEFQLSTTFIGSISIVFGSQVVGLFTVSTGLILPVDPVSGLMPLSMSSTIKFKTVATQSYDNISRVGVAPTTTIYTPPANCSQDTETSKTIDIRCNPSAGTATCTCLLVTVKKI